MTSDWHLQTTPPSARSLTKAEWMEEQACHLMFLQQTSLELGVPVVVAGDLFDRWDAPPELINMALKHMPAVYAVPGQHDLPHHRYEEKTRSAYWTLVRAGKVKDLRYYRPYNAGRRVFLHGFPWGHELAPPGDVSAHRGGDDPIHVAVAHRFVWKEGHTHPGARPEDHAAVIHEQLKGYHAAVFGDNHRGFSYRAPHSDLVLYNHGTALRRRSDEKDYQPTCGVLYSDNTVSVLPYTLETEGSWVAEDEIPDLSGFGVDSQQLVDLLMNLADHALSFRDAALRFLKDNPVGEQTQARVVEWLERVKGR